VCVGEVLALIGKAVISRLAGNAWQELKKDGLVDADPARTKLATTIVALASVGETDPGKLKWFALHAAQAAFRATKAKAPVLSS
jgi:hypothetical protein